MVSSVDDSSVNCRLIKLNRITRLNLTRLNLTDRPSVVWRLQLICHEGYGRERRGNLEHNSLCRLYILFRTFLGSPGLGSRISPSRVSEDVPMGFEAL